MPSAHVVSKIERAYLTASRSFLSGTRRLRKGSSALPTFKHLAEKFVKARAATARASAKASARASARASKTPAPLRTTTVSARKSALTEKAKLKEDLLKAKAALEEQEKLAKAKAAKARKEAKAAALAAAEKEEKEVKRSLEEISDLLAKVNIESAYGKRNGNPWQRRRLSPIAEGGTRRKRK